jgi:hypothetical protein
MHLGLPDVAKAATVTPKPSVLSSKPAALPESQAAASSLAVEEDEAVETSFLPSASSAASKFIIFQGPYHNILCR